MLTKKQKPVLDYINKYSKENGYAPTLEEIRKKFKLASVSTAHFYVEKLKEGGYLDKIGNKHRAIRVQKDISSIKIPLLGTIAAGQPIEALETSSETVSVARSELNGRDKHYALRVQGNSMIDEGIFDGDVVVIRKQETAENGQTVVAVIDDNETTLKKMYREHGRFRLQPANPTLFPIYRNDVEVRGVVVKIIRNLESQLDQAKSKNDKYVRKIDYSWDYRGEKTKSYTHGIHTYPAMFIPQVGRRLLETYSKEDDTVCDIFCGSGTALVESKLIGRNAY